MKKLGSKIRRLMIMALVVCFALAASAPASAQALNFPPGTFPPLPPPPSFLEQIVYALIGLLLTLIGK